MNRGRIPGELCFQVIYNNNIIIARLSVTVGGSAGVQASHSPGPLWMMYRIIYSQSMAHIIWNMGSDPVNTVS